MKATRLAIAVLLTSLFSILVSAQESDDPSGPKDLVVLEKSWRKEARNQIRTEDPLRPNEDLIRQTRAEKQYIDNRAYRLPSTTEPRMPAPPIRAVPFEPRQTELYEYKFKVKNIGAKKINFIEWEYQFLHPDTGELMGSRRISSKVKIAPGRTGVVEVHLLQRPTRTIAADQLDKKPGEQFKERLLIHQIYYTDHTRWQRGP
jgi:hypothetical protein